ncbi:MAG: NAD(P)H-hydrate epimerase [Xanthomonadaceae bacterium]|nr:NAD(P)H-hydrate epimerase [Xanthomonadaceae bacterium]
MTFYSLTQLRQIEHDADHAGIDLMQRAARSATDWVSAHISKSRPILVAVGTGNNGGDALWVALNLDSRGFNVILFIPEPVISPQAQEALRLCRLNALPEIETLTNLEELTECDPKNICLIDGLFGIGLNRALSQKWCDIIESLNELKTKNVLALDTPSGLNPYTHETFGAVIYATATLTFLSDKPALYFNRGKQYAGDILVDALDLPRHLRPNT